ncbi:MAG: hypothetical protein JNL70_26455 [Saprospiraceae bacterium]|nr:hypothetical protein [Saprospiraceae bacterium]
MKKVALLVLAKTNTIFPFRLLLILVTLHSICGRTGNLPKLYRTVCALKAMVVS